MKRFGKKKLQHIPSVKPNHCASQFPIHFYVANQASTLYGSFDRPIT